MDDIDSGKLDETYKVGAKPMRAKIFEWGYKMAQEMKTNKKHLMNSSWRNFGLFLRCDGSQDNDINTIQ